MEEESNVYSQRVGEEERGKEESERWECEKRGKMQGGGRYITKVG